MTFSKKMYRVFLVESERGWGQTNWFEDFKTREEAQARIEEVNSKNNFDGPVPDCYVLAYPAIDEVSK